MYRSNLYKSKTRLTSSVNNSFRQVHKENVTLSNGKLLGKV